MAYSHQTNGKLASAGFAALLLTGCAAGGQAPKQNAQPGANAPVEAVVQSEAARQAVAEKVEDTTPATPTRPPESAR